MKWKECFSKTHKQTYWYNTENNESVWIKPKELQEEVSLESVNSEANGKRKRNEINEDSGTSTGSAKKSNSNVEVAIIVPFRDCHVEQKRSQQLKRFFPEISLLITQNSNVTFRIYIIEQSNDTRKFNRGKLLNIGFDIAKKDGCRIFVFHDVDLLPSPELIPYYTTPVGSQPVHIARVWSRYSKNTHYFGGIVAFSGELFESLNGFPNTFWGWGGEDDELYNRTKEVGMRYTAPTSGSIIDMEDMTLETKLQFLREHRDWKCMNKTEVLAEHTATWRSNGLSDLHYKELSSHWLSPSCVKITVDVELNNHWTDLVCCMDSNQMEPIDLIKTRFSESVAKQS